MPIDYDRWTDADADAQTDVAEQLAQLRARVDQLAVDVEVALRDQAMAMPLFREKIW